MTLLLSRVTSWSCCRLNQAVLVGSRVFCELVSDTTPHLALLSPPAEEDRRAGCWQAGAGGRRRVRSAQARRFASMQLSEFQNRTQTIGHVAQRSVQSRGMSASKYSNLFAEGALNHCTIYLSIMRRDSATA